MIKTWRDFIKHCSRNFLNRDNNNNESHQRFKKFFLKIFVWFCIQIFSSQTFHKLISIDSESFHFSFVSLLTLLELQCKLIKFIEIQIRDMFQLWIVKIFRYNFPREKYKKYIYIFVYSLFYTLYCIFHYYLWLCESAILLKIKLACFVFHIFHERKERKTFNLFIWIQWKGFSCVFFYIFLCDVVYLWTIQNSNHMNFSWKRFIKAHILSSLKKIHFLSKFSIWLHFTFVEILILF